jgi:hypothetical protein
VFICGQYAFAGKNKLATDEHGSTRIKTHAFNQNAGGGPIIGNGPVQDVECVFLRGDLGRGGQQEVLAA